MLKDFRKRLLTLKIPCCSASNDITVEYSTHHYELYEIFMTDNIGHMFAYWVHCGISEFTVNSLSSCTAPVAPQ